jgi:hypothetical protein
LVHFFLWLAVVAVVLARAQVVALVVLFLAVNNLLREQYIQSQLAAAAQQILMVATLFLALTLRLAAVNQQQQAGQVVETAVLALLGKVMLAVLL